MEKARTEAQRLIRDERLLRDPSYEPMRERVAKLWSTNVEWS